jgi:hypothetical protein
MQKSHKKSLNPLNWINSPSLLAQEFPTAILVFGVVANFAWLVVVFWFLSYWIIWYWA